MENIRTRELLNNLLNEFCVGKKASEIIAELIDLGFTPAELVAEFSWNKDDVINVLKDNEMQIPGELFNNDENNITENYLKHKQVMSELCIADIARLKGFMGSIKIPKDLEDKRDNVMEPFQNVICSLITDEHCPKCGKLLFQSDLPQYRYICPKCDENFY